MSGGFLEVSIQDVQRLDDVEARDLIRRLCDAEVRGQRLPLVGLVAGGHQNAADGGVDVSIWGLPASMIPGFIPRTDTGFQSKAESMAPSNISKEMKLGGKPRKILEDLAAVGGAYVIVSTRDNPTDSALKNRLASMRAAAGPLADHLTLDFYGADRLATWANQYPGVAMWVRERAGRPVSGWSGYGFWSARDQDLETPLIVDSRTRLRTRKAEALEMAAGLSAMRQALAQGQAVRLVGLSGHGKTRLAQALFDERVGVDALPPGLAIYGDYGRGGMEPHPRGLAEQLVAEDREAILVVDNCPGGLHRTLLEVLDRPGSRVRLLTVEFDVGVDDFEATTEFRLDRASDELVETLLKSRGFDLTDSDRRRIADFSGGNARIALVVARSASGQGSMASLNDAELLDRLFGRNAPPDLRRLAETSAMVFSFAVQVLEGQDAELPPLAALADVSVDTFYAAVADLLGLELIQARRSWRALLPQALAGKLAASALERLHPDRVWASLVEQAPGRLLNSFCHRLGLLHDVPKAVALVERLLAADGPVGDLLAGGELALRRLSYLAPAAPKAALVRLEAAWDADIAAVAAHDQLDDMTRVVMQLAYDPDLFPRCVRLLSRLPLGDRDRNAQAGNYFEAMFQIFLSGSEALPQVRVDLVSGWLAEHALHLAERAISAMLKTPQVIGSDNTFGARQRSYGWQPQSADDQNAWFNDALQLLLTLAEQDRLGAAKILAERFDGLWGLKAVRARLLEVTRTILAEGHDDRVWFAVRDTIANGPAPDPDLVQLEIDLRPQGTADIIRAYVFNPTYKFHNQAGPEGKAESAKAYEMARTLGENAAADPVALGPVAAELIRTRETQAFCFGEGYASKSGDLEADWVRLTRILAAADKYADPSLLQGFLRGVQSRAPEKIGPWLDAAVEVPGVSIHLAALQITAGVDAAGIARWVRLIEEDRIPLLSFKMGGMPLEGIDAETIRPFVMALAKALNGKLIALDVLSMRLHGVPEAQISEGFRRLGRDLLASFTFDRRAEAMVDYHLSQLVETCLVGHEGDAVARELAKAVKAGALKTGAHSLNYPSLLKALFEQQPMATLDVLVVDDGAWNEIEDLVLGHDPDPENASLVERQPISGLDEEIARTWWAADMNERGPRLALVVPYALPGEDGSLVWRPLARDLLDSDAGPKILEAFFHRFFPMYGWGAPRDRYAQRRPMLTALVDHPRDEISKAARALITVFDERVKKYVGMSFFNEDQAFE